MLEDFSAVAILVFAFFLLAVLLPLVAPYLVDSLVNLFQSHNALPFLIAMGATIIIGGAGYFVWEYGITNALRFSSLADFPQTLRRNMKIVLPYSAGIGVFACVVRIVKKY